MRPTINSAAFPATPDRRFWSSSPFVDYSDSAWFVNFSYGVVNGDSVTSPNSGTVRLVRASQLPDREAALNFPTSIDELNRIAEAKRQEEDCRARAQRAAAERGLIAGSAQTMCLQAGRAQRNGSVLPVSGRKEAVSSRKTINAMRYVSNANRNKRLANLNFPPPVGAGQGMTVHVIDASSDATLLSVKPTIQESLA